MSRTTIASFAAIGAGALLLLGFAAWTVRPDRVPPPPSTSARSAGASARMAGPPAERPCLAAPNDAGEDEMVASAGLDPEVIRAVMRGAAQSTLSCFSGSSAVSMLLSINVSCSGRVARVDITDEGGADAQVRQCVQAALKKADFPAHALPDGEVFEYPLSYSPPGASLP